MSAAELLMAYRRGWGHGATARARDRRFDGHDREDLRNAYARGYVHGYDALVVASTKEAERLGYDARMSILRSTEEG